MLNIPKDKEQRRKLFEKIHEENYGNIMYGLTRNPFYKGKKASEIEAARKEQQTMEAEELLPEGVDVWEHLVEQNKDK